MSQDGRGQIVPREVINDRPIQSDVACECGGTYYASARSQYVRCSGGEIRCTRCGRKARRFGKTYTCGMECHG
jgi:hypothetical protein